MSIKSATLVLIQIVTMLYLAITNYPVVKGFGLIMQIVAVLLGIWAILTIRIGNFNIQPEVKSNSLITSGPYKWIRNPMYLSVILFYLPIIVENFNLLNLLVSIILIITLLMKMNSEEQFLEERFSDDYTLYKKNTKRLIPFIY